ncbi:hypothetical protein D9756_008503 [Leucocoprinus leucothites]|uniref:F-box domain-containing protein n=1 Tax=Leucocoprinus leucothites TaxID=201217 RepID=A0A8H5CZ69_9AGAR|nr:hypothetical protein D9756_008503 [Leucoagaricus leucothites]
MELDHDIWHEITCLLANQSDKQTLLVLALVSRTLSGLALPALWRDFFSLEEIVFTINSFASEDDHFLVSFESPEWDDEAPAGRWDLYRPIPEHARIRVSEYLSYVRTYVHDPNRDEEDRAKDEYLWSHLPIWLGLDGPLFPRLHHLYIQVFAGRRADVLLSLLCPSIGNLILEFQEGPVEVKEISTIIDAIVNKGCDLHRLQFVGPICPPLLSDPSAFKNLRCLDIAVNNSEPVEPSSKVSIADLLTSLPSLYHFYCDTEAYIMPLPGSDIICHDSLTDLDIYGPASEIEKILLGFRFPLLLILQFVAHEGTFPQFERLYETITSRSPMIRQFFSGLGSGLHEPTLEDLTPLFKLALESLDCQISKHLSASDVETLVKSFPKLQKLHLSTPSTYFHAAEIYSILSQHPRLEDLEIPVDLQDLLSPSALDDTTVGAPNHVPSKSRIWKLSLDSASNIPSVMPEIGNLAKNLLRLFPNLSNVCTMCSIAFEREMERMIWALQTDVVQQGPGLTPEY